VGMLLACLGYFRLRLFITL